MAEKRAEHTFLFADLETRIGFLIGAIKATRQEVTERA